MNLSTYRSYGIALFLLTLTIAMLINPNVAFDASLRGLQLWWTIVFPALLPFFVLSELLVAFGVVHFIGALFEPFMRIFFRLPGVAGYALAMSMASGSPSGARITAQLRNEQALTKDEAERLIMFTNTANPLFIFGAVAIGFFHNPKIGLFLALIHYSASIFIGICLRFYRRTTQVTHRPKHPYITHAFHTLHEKQASETRPIGKILGDAVTHSVHLLLMIGGFIMVFSVLNQLLISIHLTSFLAVLLTPIVQSIGLHTQTVTPFLTGMLEMTLGIQHTSLQAIPLEQKLALTSFLLGFSGFSIHAQVATILSQSDIRYMPYLISRIAHGMLAYFLATMTLLNDSIQSYLIYSSTHTLETFAQKSKIALTFTLNNGPIFTLLILYIYVIYLVIHTKKKFQR